ncbi:MAG: hypothetical protein LC789_15890, partial [Actinobacteria bacterium]|nr:hypothetical protein [Actinomycetota bacterium]
YRDRPVLWHSGGVDGFATHTLLLPQQRLGVTVSANLSGSLLPLAAALDLLDGHLAPDEPTAWYDVLHAAGDGAPPPALRLEESAPPELLGTYRNEGYGDLVVRPGAQGLQVRLGESSLSARHVEQDTWEFRYDLLDAPYPFTFERDGRAIAVAVTAPLDPPSGPSRFVRVDA